MCTSWTAEQWLEEATSLNNHYTLVDTRYNQAGEVARTYSYASGRGWYAVFPGYGNHPECGTQASALDRMSARGYSLLEKPVTIAELIGPEPEPETTSGLRDLVEDFA